MFIGGMVTISSHGWLMALFYPHPNDQQALCCRSINSRCDPLQILWGCIDGQASEAWKAAFATLWLLQKTKEWNKQENQHIHWLVVDLPLWKIWVRQLGLRHSQLNGKIKNVPNHQPDPYIHELATTVAIFENLSNANLSIDSCLFMFSST